MQSSDSGSKVSEVRLYSFRELVQQATSAQKRHGWDDTVTASVLHSLLETHKDFIGIGRLKDVKEVRIALGHKHRGTEDPLNVREGKGCDKCGREGPSWVTAGNPGAGFCDKCLFETYALEDDGFIFIVETPPLPKCSVCAFTAEAQETIEDHEDREHPELKTLVTYQISGTREYGFSCTVRAASPKEAYQKWLATDDEKIPDFELSNRYDGRVDTVTKDPDGPEEEDVTEQAEIEA